MSEYSDSLEKIRELARRASATERKRDSESPRAVEEAQELAEGRDLGRESQEKDHDRKQRFLDNMGIAVVIVFWVALAFFGIIAGTWLWHLVMPESLHFLTPAQYINLLSILLTGTVAGLLPRLIKKYM